MFFKKSLIVFSLLIIVLCCFNTVNALDNITESNDEPVLGENNGVVLNNGVVISDEVVYYNPVNTKEVNLSESECCSFIIQHYCAPILCLLYRNNGQKQHYASHFRF